jgi:Spy/CpxP family protein refolding chaperone
MSNKILKVLLIFLLMAAPILASAKDMPGGKWWQNSRISSRLNLSKAEKTSLDEKFIESRRKLIKLKSLVESERFELEVLLESEPLNEAKVLEQYQRVESARSDLTGERFRFLLEVRKIIGLERYQELKASFQKLRQERARRMLAPDKERRREGSMIAE